VTLIEPLPDESPLVLLHRACMKRPVKVTKKRVAAVKYRVELECGHTADIVRWSDGDDASDPMLAPVFCPRCRDALVKEREGV
jgi:hypothetical protein